MWFSLYSHVQSLQALSHLIVSGTTRASVNHKDGIMGCWGVVILLSTADLDRKNVVI